MSALVPSDDHLTLFGDLGVTRLGISGDLTTLDTDQLLVVVEDVLVWWGASTWALGDLVAEVLRRVLDGERVSESVWANVHQASNTRQVAVVAAFPLARRRAALSWSHHELVAGMDERNQDRLLDAAEAEGLSVRALRSLIQQEADDMAPRLEGMPVVTRWKPAPRLAVRVGALLAAHPEAKAEIDAAVDDVLGRWGA